MVTKTVTINAVDYSDNVDNFIIRKESLYFPGEFELIIVDTDRSIYAAIERYQEVKISLDSSLVFTGKIIDIEKSKNDSKILTVFGYDKSYFIHRTAVFRKFTAQTASQVITSIVNNELSSYGFGTGQITATTETDNYTFNSKAAGQIFNELAEKENFWWYVDENDNLVFKPKTLTDSGVELNYGNNDIKQYNFEKRGGDLVNQVYVVGAPGRPPNTSPVGAIVEDDALIDKYGDILPLITVNKPELTTIEECQAYGEYEIRRRNQDPDIGYVETSLNTNLDIGALTTLTISPEGYDTELFGIQTVEHNFSDKSTIINVIYYTRETADLVLNTYDSARRAEFQLSDHSLTFAKIKKFVEQLILKAYVTVEKRTTDAATYGGFAYGDKYYGQSASGGYTTVVNNKKIQVTNQMLEDFLAVIGQIVTVPNDLSATNAYIAVGSGRTTIDVSDNTALPNESVRNAMEAGYPQRTATGTIDWQIIIDDTDAETLTIDKVGLFNSSSGTSREIVGLLTNTINKSLDEDVRITIQLVVTGNKATTAGLNELVEQLTMISTDYTDSGSYINIVLDGTPLSEYNEIMASGYPKFMNVGKTRTRYQIVITGAEVTSNSIDGETFTEMDLYNGDPATFTKIIDGVVASTTFNELQDLYAQFDVEMIRG